MQWNTSMWRVGLVFVLYAVFYLSSRDIIPLWLALFFIPIYFFVEPISEDMAKNHIKNRQNGFLPYGVTMSGVSLVFLIAIIYIHAYLHNLAFLPTVIEMSQSGLAVAPVLLTVFASWRVREKAYKHYEPIWKRGEKAARKAARKESRKTVK